MAEKDGIGEVAKKLVPGLTSSEVGVLFARDNRELYSGGVNVSEYDFIYKERAKLVEILAGADKVGDQAQDQALDKMLAKAKESLKAKEPKDMMKDIEISAMPMARLVEAANVYYEAGGKENKAKGDTLIDYAIQQAQIQDNQNKDKEGIEPMTKKLEVFKDEVAKHQGDVSRQKGTPKVDASQPDYAAMLAASDFKPTPKTEVPNQPFMSNGASIAKA